MVRISVSAKKSPTRVTICCSMGDPFQGPKLGSCLTLGNELSEETHVLTKQVILLGKGTRVESSRVREPRRTALLHGSQSGKSHGQRSLVGCSPWGHEELDMTERLHFHFSLSCIREGNCNPLQWSCLENPRDRGAWWAAIYGVAQSRTRLKQLSSMHLMKK